MAKKIHVGILIVLFATFFGCDKNTGTPSTNDGGGKDIPSQLDSTVDTVSIDIFGGELTMEPQDQTITYTLGQTPPTVTYVVKADGQIITPTFSVDKADIGKITTAGVFTPSGNLGGQTVVSAYYGGREITANLTVLIKAEQNGFTGNNGNPGPGGFGGVGGEGLGEAIDQPVIDILEGTPTTSNIKLLYPYDKTVWPLDVLAPLLQWDTLTNNQGDGILIELKSSYYEYKGYFSRPPALASGLPFIRHPIPQDVWKAATKSAAGTTLDLRVVIAADGKAYGPLTSTWTVAAGSLKGTVYYQSYGTALAKNNIYPAIGGDGKFGGATLAIKGGATDPTLVAGKDGGYPECRVCHTVSGDGNRMIVQHGDDYTQSSSYDLKNSYAENDYPDTTGTHLGWIGMTPNGAYGVGNAAPLSGGANSNSNPMSLYDMVSGNAVSSTGLPSGTRAAFPVFSPSGEHLMFTQVKTPLGQDLQSGDALSLAMLDFDEQNRAFSNIKTIYTGVPSARPGWPAFWPTEKAAVFQLDLQGGNPIEYFSTRYGNRGEIWWVDLASGQAQRLNALNGMNPDGTLYIPTAPENHNADNQLNYEPTISPIASGGYAWVVFMSRRLYGNVATINPWWSDPREYDLFDMVTPKKLWVAAIDLNPSAGKDPSHPAFYLPGQELHAGNTRGFWVVDPCKEDGNPCESGDECCSGHCTRASPDAEPTCGQHTQGCVEEYNKCEKDEDCCDYPKYQCVNNRCALWVIR